MQTRIHALMEHAEHINTAAAIWYVRLLIIEAMRRAAEPTSSQFEMESPQAGQYRVPIP